MDKKKNKKKKGIKKYYWLIILLITTVITMWLYGMTEFYIPEPYDIGFGQYVNLGVGIIIISLLLVGFLLGKIFKTSKK